MRRENFFLHVWEGEKSHLFEVIEPLTFDVMKRDNPEHSKWLFGGKWANVFVIASDEGITREIALELATKYMKGDYEIQTVNLKTCTSSVEHGIEKTPRH